MCKHDGRLDVSVRRQRVSLNCLDVGERLKSVFAHETRHLLLVIAERLSSMPDSPEVYVAAAKRIGIVVESAMR